MLPPVSGGGRAGTGAGYQKELHGKSGRTGKFVSITPTPRGRYPVLSGRSSGSSHPPRLPGSQTSGQESDGLFGGLTAASTASDSHRYSLLFRPAVPARKPDATKVHKIQKFFVSLTSSKILPLGKMQVNLLLRSLIRIFVPRHIESASAFLLKSKLGHFGLLRRKRLMLASFFGVGISSIFVMGSPRPRFRVE